MSKHAAVSPVTETTKNDDRKKPKKRRAATKQEMAQRKRDVTRLRQRGYSCQEVAKKLRLPVKIIYQTSYKLIGEGKVKRDRRGGVRGTAFWYNLNDERVQIIIKMVKARATGEEMGAALGCTRQNVVYVIHRLQEEYGDTIFIPSETIWTPQEAAKELDVSADSVCRLCQSGEVPARRRGVLRSGYLINEQGMQILRTHPLVTRQRQCPMCGQTFTTAKGQGKQCTCLSKKCRAEYRRQKRQQYKEHKPTVDSLRGWHKDLWLRLQSHRLPKNEQWLALVDACRLTSLSKIRVSWLGYRNIVLVRADPVKIAYKTGQPEARYAASEMKIVREVFKAYSRHGRKKRTIVKRK